MCKQNNDQQVGDRQQPFQMFLHPFHIKFFVSTRKVNKKHSVF